jgi:hypothetical protein
MDKSEPETYQSSKLDPDQDKDESLDAISLKTETESFVLQCCFNHLDNKNMRCVEMRNHAMIILFYVHHFLQAKSSGLMSREQDII